MKAALVAVLFSSRSNDEDVVVANVPQKPKLLSSFH